MKNANPPVSPQKKEVATISEARAKAMHLVEKTMIVKKPKAPR